MVYQPRCESFLVAGWLGTPLAVVDMCLLLGVASALSSMVGVWGRFDNLQLCDICHRS